MNDEVDTVDKGPRCAPTLLPYPTLLKYSFNCSTLSKAMSSQEYVIETPLPVSQQISIGESETDDCMSIAGHVTLTHESSFRRIATIAAPVFAREQV